MFRLTSSSLYDQSTFYDRFYKDLRGARHRVVVESPFITQRRSMPLLSIVSKLKPASCRVARSSRMRREGHDRTHQEAH